ncbi:MAG: ribonuclease PH [Deinococcales bacterium]
MRKNRQANEIRAITVTPGYSKYAEGSAWVEWGHNKVLATVSIDNSLPPHLRYRKNNSGGWLNAEYALLPRSTHDRVVRERLYSGGRTQEIQRLLGRAFRSIINLDAFPNQTLTIDVDVIQADGGTRCAGIVAGYAALFNAVNKLIHKGKLDEWPLEESGIAAISLGIVNGETLIDLEYNEDMQASLDINVVATGEGKIIEVQGGSEKNPVSAEVYVKLIAQGITATQQILENVKKQLS